MTDDHSPPGFDPEDIAPSPLQERNWRITSLALDLSGRCNLACRYCAESATQPARRPYMTEDILDKAINLLVKDQNPGAYKSIRLGSGEPMLAKPLLRRIEQRLLKMHTAGRLIQQVFITTNGTLLDSETRDWLLKTGWNVKISLDGPAAVHDRWRITTQGRPTYKIVAAAAADLAMRMPDRFSVSAVLCKDNDPAKVFNGIAKLGVQRIELVPACHPDASILPDEQDIYRYRSFVLEYADRLIVGNKRLPKLVRVVNAARRVMGYDVKRIVCGAGRTFLGVGPDGLLYPCFRFIGVRAFCLGSLIKGLSPQALEKFRHDTGMPYERRKDCRDCWAAPMCGGPCFAEAELMGPGGGRPFGLHCNYVKADAEAAIALIQGMRRRNPEQLLELLEGLVEF